MFQPKAIHQLDPLEKQKQSIDRRRKEGELRLERIHDPKRMNMRVFNRFVF